MLFVAGVLKDLLTKNTENAGQHSNLRKHYFFKNPQNTFNHINFFENLSNNKSFINNITIVNGKNGDQFTIYKNKVIRNNKEEEEFKNDKEDDEYKDDCESKGTGSFIDDNIWDEMKLNISSVSSNYSTTKSYLYKWQPRFLEKSLSSSSLEKTSSNINLENCRNKIKKQKICKINYDEIENICEKDLDYISTTQNHSIKISKDVLEKLISKYNLICGDNFKIEDEYIDDTYNDEGCFTHLQFHIL
ncbi:Hypothetical protein SRAE_1000287500 [Strongyloides ratti]|uniref:Uncharacterized protein n=1 Tax=Strongyloides ratti TaxID=34506 RepID=A0A090L4H8_STRRB|nr:Hypothetical protein SRAE_1000287500 [Strongyloides ratti]CEF64622.1 Hypothetical protein SRAE_1000287500 [Strongyloides ratti]